MSKQTIKAKGLSRNAKVQVLHMDDYFGGGLPYTSKPVTFGKFLDELAEDFEVEQLEKDTLFAKGHDGKRMNLLEEWYLGSGDGGENFALLTVVDGQIKVVAA